MASPVARFAGVAFAFLLPLVEGPAQVACVAALLGVAFTARGDLRVGAAQLARSSWLPALLLLIWAVAGYFGVARGALRGERLSSEDTTRPLLALAFGLGVALARSEDEDLLLRCAQAFGLGAAISAAYGLLQVGFGELPLDRYLAKNPLSPQLWVPGRVGVVRCASGLFYNRLKLAHTGLVALALFVPLAAAGFSVQSSRVGGGRRGAVLVVAVLVLCGVTLSHARMALVGTFVGLAALALAVGHVRAVLLAVIGLPALAFAALRLIPEQQARVGSVSEDIEVRLHMFRTGLKLFLDHPIIGVGHGFYRRIVGPTWDGIGMDIDAHNIVLHVLSETGLVGGVAFFGAVSVAIVRVARAVVAGRKDPSPKAWLHRFALAGLVGLMTLGATHVFTHHAPVFMSFALLLGVASAARR